MSERERRKCLEVLGLPHSSSDDDIKKAYRRLALQYHPDKNTDDGAKEQFQEISYAYKYLIEGPESVGAEEDGQGIPLEVLIRLFPWLLTDARFSFPHPAFPGFHRGFFPGFHDPFHDPFFPGFYNDVYVDTDDSSEYEDIYFHQPDSKPKSTYVPGPSKEEKRKEKKKRAKERRKAAKMNKPQPTPKPKKEQVSSQTTGSKTSAANNPTTVNSTSYTDDINMPDIKGNSSPHPHLVKSKISDLQTGSHDSSSTSVGAASLIKQNKKSKKKLKKEQKQREKEMESIATEFKKKQQEQAEKEARRQAAKKERERTLKTQEPDSSIADTDSVITGNDDSGSVRTDLDFEEEQIRDQVICDDVYDNFIHDDDILDEDDSDDDLEVDGKESDDPTPIAKPRNRFSPALELNSKEKGQSNNSKKSKLAEASQQVQDRGRETQKGRKSSHKENRSSSRGAEASGISSTSGRHSQTFMKSKRHGRQKEAEWEDWPESASRENSPMYDDGLMPQSEAEEMRMFHEAILRSKQEAQQKGKKETNKNKSSTSRCDELCFIEEVSSSEIETDVAPKSEEEELIMLETALRESQITAQWEGNMDTLDDVSDGEDSIFSGGASACTGAVGDWHKSIGNNSSFLKQNKTNTQAEKSNLTNGGLNLGGLGSVRSGFNSPLKTGAKGGPGSVNYSLNGISEFDRTVGGKVKIESGKVKADSKKKQSESWEFGGSKVSQSKLKTPTAEGLQFGVDDDDNLSFVNGTDWEGSEYSLDSTFKGNIPSMVFSCTYQSSQVSSDISQNGSQKQMGNRNVKDLQNTKLQSPIPAHCKHPKASAETGGSNSSKNAAHKSTALPSQPTKPGSSQTASSENMSSAHCVNTSMGDMDDIDDVDTFGESSTPSFSSLSEPASSFDLNIPAALCSKEKIKSYYQRKK